MRLRRESVAPRDCWAAIWAGGRALAGIAGGFESPPQETEVEVYNLQP
jgi:hypothetical protein